MTRIHFSKFDGLRRVVLTLVGSCLLMARAQAVDDLTQPIRVSPDGHFLTQPDGQPFFWLGDTGWELFMRLTRDEADYYLRDRARKGFTVIQAVALGGPIDALGVPNRYGQVPLIEKDPRRPNPKYFEHVDWVVNRAAHYGLRIAILPVWGAAVVGGYINNSKQRIFDPSSAESYGRWIGTRYRNKGVIWILGGDTNPIGVDAALKDTGFKPPSEMTHEELQAFMEKAKRGTFLSEILRDSIDMRIIDYRPVWDAMAKGIVAGQGGRPLVTYHITCCNWPGTAQPRTSLYFSDRSWLALNMIQSSHFRNPGPKRLFPGIAFGWNGPFNYQPIKDEYDSVPTRPVLDGEPRYEDLAVDVECFDSTAIAAKGFWKAYDARNAAYHGVFAGAAGHTYGNAMVWQFYDPSLHFLPECPPTAFSWKKGVDRPGAGQMQHLKALMLSRPYFARIPDQSLIVGDQGEGENHIGATRHRDGSYAMVYAPKGQPITLDLNKITGRHAVAWWFDPSSGAATRIPGSFATTGPTTFVPPHNGPESDWVLVVDDENRTFGAPGNQHLQ